MYYSTIKRGKTGTCNLCLEEKALSWDHVPPKGGINLTPVEIDTVFQVFAGDASTRMVRESQNGVKFRTICSDCNSLLGFRYDPIINDFAITVGRYLNSNLHFPEIISHRTRPAALMRGLLGHLIAAKNEIDKVKFDIQVSLLQKCIQ